MKVNVKTSVEKHFSEANLFAIMSSINNTENHYYSSIKHHLMVNNFRHSLLSEEANCCERLLYDERRLVSVSVSEIYENSPRSFCFEKKKQKKSFRAKKDLSREKC